MRGRRACDKILKFQAFFHISNKQEKKLKTKKKTNLVKADIIMILFDVSDTMLLMTF